MVAFDNSRYKHLFHDGGMRDGLEELSMAEQPRRQKAAFPEGLKALCSRRGISQRGDDPGMPDFLDLLPGRHIQLEVKTEIC
jgi:hypothetical protein